MSTQETKQRVPKKKRRGDPAIALLLAEAIAIAQQERPGITKKTIAKASRLTQSSLSRAKGGCTAAILLAVLRGVKRATGVEVRLKLERVV